MSLPDRSRFVAPAFALLLVFSAFGGGLAVQPASATHDCSNVDSLVFFGSLTILNYDKCAQDHTAGSVEDVRDASTNQTKMDIYNAALSQNAQQRSATSVYDNYLNDTEATAWMAAEAAIARAYKNGSSKALAKSKAKKAIQDYYAVKQKNLVGTWNANVVAVHILAERAANESDIGGQYVDIEASGYSDSGTYLHDNPGNGTIQLVNSSSADIRYLNGYFSDASATYEYHGSQTIGIVRQPGSTSNGGQMNYPHTVWVDAPDADYSRIALMKPAEYRNRWNRIESQNSALQSEVDPFVNSTWDAYTAGTINATDVLSSVNQMERYGTDYQNGSTNLYNSVAALSALGLDTPELNGTGTMAVTYNTVDYHGLVMAREAPNGSWQANTTYNASNISGPVFLVTTDGKKIDLSGNFTIGTISSTDGSTVTEVTATKVVYKTANTSELLDKMQRIEELRKDMESKEQSAASDSSGSGTPIDPKYLLGAVVIVGLLAYGRGQQGGD